MFFGVFFMSEDIEKTETVETSKQNTEQANTTETTENGEVKVKTKKPITLTKTLVGIAVFAALSYALSFLEFPIFPATSFLKLDFSSVMTLLAGFIYGPISAIAVAAIKEGICVFTKSSTAGIGELANFLVAISFVLVPAITYRYKKGFKLVVLVLAIGCILQTAVATVLNRFLLFPLYMGAGAQAVFNSVWYYIVAFNMIKTVAVSIITILLYKRISYLIKRL